MGRPSGRVDTEPVNSPVPQADPARSEGLGYDDVRSPFRGNQAFAGEKVHARVPAGLLVHRGAELEASVQIDAGFPYRRRREQGGGDAALHIARAPAVDPAVLHHAFEGIDRPVLAGRHDVGMSVEVQGGHRRPAGKTAHQVYPGAFLRVVRMISGGQVPGFEAERGQAIVHQPGAGQVFVARRVHGGYTNQVPQKRRHVFAEAVY